VHADTARCLASVPTLRVAESSITILSCRSASVHCCDAACHLSLSRGARQSSLHSSILSVHIPKLLLLQILQHALHQDPEAGAAAVASEERAPPSWLGGLWHHLSDVSKYATTIGGHWTTTTLTTRTWRRATNKNATLLLFWKEGTNQQPVLDRHESNLQHDNNNNNNNNNNVVSIPSRSREAPPGFRDTAAAHALQRPARRRLSAQRTQSPREGSATLRAACFALQS
jgi:hypothetical protein